MPFLRYVSREFLIISFFYAIIFSIYAYFYSEKFSIIGMFLNWVIISINWTIYSITVDYLAAKDLLSKKIGWYVDAVFILSGLIIGIIFAFII